ncbi:MAG: DUF177 domain-containing protein [Rhizobiales bacterium]|jgi:uncharacterized metal-binding protein YceD (DUF177 family)|nr:DUF177 domain-containing protein [Hyphomicrobiales bacterium]
MDKTASPATVLWSVPVAVEDIPDTGLHIEIEAPAPTRAALAELAAVRELPQLAAVFDLTRQGDGVHVAGQVSARVGQSCVVTLEPIENPVDEAVDLRFAPQAETPKSDTDPEPLVGGRVDLGAIATEFLILGIDPYPRKADATFTPPKSEDDGAHPFSGLEALKKRLGGSQP